MEYKHWNALATLFNKYDTLKLFHGVEVGTKKGSNAHQLLKMFPKLHLTCVDPYTPYKDDKGKLISKAHQEECLKAAREHLRPFISKDRVGLILKDSVAAAEFFPEGSIDFVFIDACHTYEAVSDDIQAWLPAIRSGGLLTGHDYEMEGIRKAVNEFAAKNNKWIEYRPGLAQVWGIRV